MGLAEAPVEAVTAVKVVSSAGHVIELADAGHHSAGVLLLHGLAAGRDERLDGPAQQLLPINAGLVDVVLDLSPGPSFDLVPLSRPRRQKIGPNFQPCGQCALAVQPAGKASPAGRSRRIHNNS